MGEGWLGSKRVTAYINADWLVASYVSFSRVLIGSNVHYAEVCTLLECVC